MRRGKYRDYYYLVLRDLATLSPVSRFESLRSRCRIPKASLSNVLKELVRDGLVERAYSFPSHKVVKITDRGIRKWESTISISREFKVSSAAERYLLARDLKQDELFPVQRKFVERGLLYSRNNVAVFGYPGTGKTLVAEMAMANELEDGGKVLFCTPYRALDWQKYQDFQRSFGEKLQKTVALSDGDSPVRAGQLDKADVVVATYERVEAAIRTGESWLRSVTLACVDELTHLGEDERGGTLDNVLTKLKDEPRRRVITLSSLVGNSIGLAEWLKAEPIIESTPSQDIKEYVVYKKRGSLVFQGKDGTKNAVNTTLDAVSYVVQENLNKGLTTLVFVGSRPHSRHLSAELTSLHDEDPDLKLEAGRFLEDATIENTSLTKRLCETLKHGVAFHHAGLQRAARRLVERLLKEKRLKTVVATTTLSHGIDYRIDNVVIDLPGILKIHELQGYEYLNLMGRTGRPGLSVEANVFILVQPRHVRRVLKKYFFGSPEEVFPTNTFDKSSIAATVLAQAANGGTERDVLKPLRGTYRATAKRISRRTVGNVIKQMSSLGFVQKDGSRLTLTSVGSRILHSNLSPHDARDVLQLKTSISQEGLLELASGIDLARRKRGEWRFSRKNVPQILTAWINEVPIDDIRKKFGITLDDQDIIELAEYTARSLQKMADLVADDDLRHRIEVLQKRTRFGWNDDLAGSELGKLSLLIRNKNRVLARKLIDAGLTGLEEILKLDSGALARKVGVSVQTAEAIIHEASSSLSKDEPARVEAFQS